MPLFKHDFLYITFALLSYSLSFAAFIIGILNSRRHQELSHLWFYSLASIVESSISYIIDSLNFPKTTISMSSNISSSAIHLFIIIEFICIYIFFFKTKLMGEIVKKILLILSFCFFILYIILFINIKDLIKHDEKIYILQSFLVLVPCFIYIYNLFAQPPTLNLLNEPSFWFNSGILIYLTLTLPIFIVTNYITLNPLFYILNISNYLGYSIVFSFLIKAYLCNPTKVK